MSSIPLQSVAKQKVVENDYYRSFFVTFLDQSLDNSSAVLSTKPVAKIFARD